MRETVAFAAVDRVAIIDLAARGRIGLANEIEPPPSGARRRGDLAVTTRLSQTLSI
jgi:hypothetical protein